MSLKTGYGVKADMSCYIEVVHRLSPVLSLWDAAAATGNDDDDGDDDLTSDAAVAAAAAGIRDDILTNQLLADMALL